MVGALVVVACGAGSTKLLGSPVQSPVGLVIKASPQVVAHSDLRGLRDMADDLIEGMKEKGVAGYVVEEGRPMPPPRLELFVSRWDALGGKRMSSSTATSAFGLGLIGSAVQAVHAHDVRVECTVFRENEHTPADHHIFEAEDANAVSSAIIHRVFTDQRVVEDRAPIDRAAH